MRVVSSTRFQRGKNRGKEGPNDKDETQEDGGNTKPQNPGDSRTGQAKQKIALTRRNLRGHRPQKREPVQLIEMPPIPRTETRPQGIKRKCKTMHSRNKGRRPKGQLDLQNSRHTEIRNPKYSTRHKCKTKKRAPNT